MGWLRQNYSEFPESDGIDTGQSVFYGWRFIRGLDGVMYFANCIDRGITEEEAGILNER